MDNQHKKITGYRDLLQPEIDLMNEGKALAEQCRAYTEKVRTFAVITDDGDKRIMDLRWLSIGITDLQRGFMAVIRAIAQPTTF